MATNSPNARDAIGWSRSIADAHAIAPEASPDEQLTLRQSIRLAFVAALQHLPPKQRAALILTEVLGWSASEVADCLQTSVVSVNSALQRARATLAAREIPAGGELTADQRAVIERFVDAFYRYDVNDLTSLLREDATLSMPPYTLWLRGREPIGQWLAGRGLGCRGSILVPTNACGMPAFGQYRVGPEGSPYPFAIIVLELVGNQIGAWTSFLDTKTLFPHFGLPTRLEPTRGADGCNYVAVRPMSSGS